MANDIQGQLSDEKDLTDFAEPGPAPLRARI